MFRCKQCTYALGKYRCKNKASCHLGCVSYCWIHAAVHGVHTVCHDVAIAEPGSEENDLIEELQKHSQQLLDLREKLRELRIPASRMQELEAQIKQVYELLYIE